MQFSDHEVAVAAKMKKDNLTRKQIEDSGPPWLGMTLQVGDYWYSLACLYDRNINVATAGPMNGESGQAKKYGLQGKCRGCMAHHNTLNQRLRCTFDIEAALNLKAKDLNANKEWSRKVTQDVSYSLVLRVLRNGGFLFIRTQEDIDWVHTALTPEERQEHLDWILKNKHYLRGFSPIFLGQGKVWC